LARPTQPADPDVGQRRIAGGGAESRCAAERGGAIAYRGARRRAVNTLLIEIAVPV
jgi:hypothetical protein